MGRIKLNIELKGKKHWSLFDTGAVNTYIIKKLSRKLHTEKFSPPNPILLGGTVHNIKQSCLLHCKILGYPIRAHAFVIDNIGNDEDGKKIEILIGALTMQQWRIVPVPEKETLDMSHYPKEFVEF